MISKLAHLTSEQIAELIQRYYDNEKIIDLINEYELKIQPSQLVKEFPLRIHVELCPYCAENFVSSYESRTSFRYRSMPKCGNCGHIDIDSCVCRNCINVRSFNQLNAQNIKREKINEILSIIKYEKVELKSLSFAERVYLGAFIRGGILENYTAIIPTQSFADRLAPTAMLHNEIVKILAKDKKLIAIDSSSDINSIVDIDIENEQFSYYHDLVSWRVNVTDESLHKVQLINSLMNPDGIDFPAEDIFEMWRKIALNECLDYLLYSCSSVLGVDYTIGEKTISIFNDLLNHFSTSQIYGIIYKSVGDALRFKVEKGVNSRHAANSIISKAQSFGERALINKWELSKYNRKECPASIVSKFFFERISKIGERGFYEKPELINHVD